jgi:hypothetical protein
MIQPKKEKEISHRIRYFTAQSIRSTYVKVYVVSNKGGCTEHSFHHWMPPLYYIEFCFWCEYRLDIIGLTRNQC